MSNAVHVMLFQGAVSFKFHSKDVQKYALSVRLLTMVFCSAVARGGAGGARAPSVFFLKSKNRPV